MVKISFRPHEPHVTGKIEKISLSCYCSLITIVTSSNPNPNFSKLLQFFFFSFILMKINHSGLNARKVIKFRLWFSMICKSLQKHKFQIWFLCLNFYSICRKRDLNWVERWKIWNENKQKRENPKMREEQQQHSQNITTTVALLFLYFSSYLSFLLGVWIIIYSSL